MPADLEADLAFLRKRALALPGAWEDFPWGERVVKVGKKVFVFLNKVETDGVVLSLSVKLPQSADAALELPFTEPTGYGLGRAGWVTARFPKGTKPPRDLLAAWIEESWRAVAPKTLVKQLDAGPSAPPRAPRRRRGTRRGTNS